MAGGKNGEEFKTGKSGVTLFNKNIFMASTLKQELIEKSATTDNEDLLQILKADYDYFTNEGTKDVLDELSPEDKSELMNMLNEPFGKETESYEDFKKATDKWRTK